jgi:predicted MFS family arabinose efflux permease
MPDQKISTRKDPSFQQFAIGIGVATISRIIINTARRFVYPFAPVLSRSMNVPLTSVTSIIAVSQATGILGLFSGPLADRFGYRLMMISALVMLVLGMFAAGFLPVYGIVLAAIFLAGLGNTIFDPAIQAYAGERVPFRRRGLAIGLLEFSWAGSTLLGIPLISFLIERYGWRSPFFALGGMGLVVLIILKIFIPKDPKRTDRQGKDQNIWVVWKQLMNNRVVLGALGFSILFTFANENLFVIYGAWLEKSFELSIIALGLGTGLIGIAEFLGELFTALLADKIGLRRSATIGLLLCLTGYCLLPLIGRTLPFALGGLFFIFLTFEFTIVVFLSISTELVPELRASMMSLLRPAYGIGRVVGAFIGGPIWLIGGILATGLVSASISALALILLTWGLRNWRQH